MTPALDEKQSPDSTFRRATVCSRRGTSAISHAPPPFGLRNLLKVIGPGAIMAATSIGGGEWLVGPAAAVKYSSSIFLIASLAIVLQVIFNLEAIRYTLYTGEPIYGGIMRLRPGPKFWAGFYTLIGFFQLGWPALGGKRRGHAPRRVDGTHAGSARSGHADLGGDRVSSRLSS